MIIEADRHSSVDGNLRFDESQLREFAQEVAAETAQAITRIHPTANVDAGYEGPQRLAHLYRGLQEPGSWALGVYSGLLGALWGLHYLERHRLVVAGIDYCETAKLLHDAFLASPDRERNNCLFFGELGYLAFRYRVSGDVALADRAFDLIASSFRNDVDEIFWGAPGYAIACVRMHELQPHRRWSDLFSTIAQYIWQRRVVDEASGATLWQQHLDGVHVKHLGAGHGFAGVAGTLLAGFDWLPPQIQAEIVGATMDTLERTASRADGLVNWPQSISGHRPGRTAPLMQWCHGAPGVITSLYQAPQFPAAALLQQAAASVWQAGPLNKDRGGLCHGTAGNGYALLAAYCKTSQDEWLQRARVFAAHGIVQSQRARARANGFKMALWTGDVGTAVYALDCMLESPGYLTLDKF
jgi:hypothetical protein